MSTIDIFSQEIIIIIIKHSNRKEMCMQQKKRDAINLQFTKFDLVDLTSSPPNVPGPFFAYIGLGQERTKSTPQDQYLVGVGLRSV